MSITFDTEIHTSVARDVALRMVTAARTAPKAKGIDHLVAAVADAETMTRIAQHMRTMAEEKRVGEFFFRDADNVENAHALVLMGTTIEPMRLQPCGLCGFANCDEKLEHPNHPCAFNTGDLGIAVGSAVSVAMDLRVDSRVMFSIGMAVREMGLLGEEVKIVYGIPLSISGKSPFFDRKPKAH